MGGKRDSNFRAGDRAEYMAHFGLSRIAFVVSTPRQEDFGIVDFACVLASEEPKHLIFPRGAFYVQVKANANDIELKRDEIRWITHYMDLPLFICVALKDEGELEVYSCAGLWHALFLRSEPTSMRLRLQPLTKPTPDLVEDENRQHFDINIGPPILKQSLAELERDSTLAYEVMRTWIDIDIENIARRRIGRLASKTVVQWQTNVPQVTHLCTQYVYGSNYPSAEKALAPILTGLAHNYRDAKQHKKLNALRAFLDTIREHLDEHGLDFADGK